MVYNTEYIPAITGDSTVLYWGLAIFLVLLSVVFAYIVLANYKHRARSATWYKDQVYAFKVGYIHKAAKDKDIELIYPPKMDLVDELEEQVSKDLFTP